MLSGLGFLLPVTGFLVSILLIYSKMGKAASFLFFQQLPGLPFDFWKILTHLGDGAFLAASILGLAFFKQRSLALAVMVSWLSGALVVQTLKNTTFRDEPRPKAWFQEQNLQLNIPEGWKPYERNSFPSGHTATAFGLFGLLAFAGQNNNRGFICAVLAIGVGWSRIVLLQHFPLDVFTGACIGLLSIWPALRLKQWLERRYPDLNVKPLIFGR